MFRMWLAVMGLNIEVVCVLDKTQLAHAINATVLRNSQSVSVLKNGVTSTLKHNKLKKLASLTKIRSSLGLQSSCSEFILFLLF